MHFDLTDLRLFLNVQQAGTITGGAQATHMTLASASERIRGMEDSLGVPLLLRERRGVAPTPAGRTLARHARLLLQQVERMQGELGDYGAGVRGHVRLLCNTSALSEHLPEALGRYLLANPGVSVDLEERPSDEIADAVRNDTCDLGIAADSADLEGLETFLFRPDPLVLVVPHGHPLAKRPAIGLADAADQPFVGLAEGHALQEHLTRHARRLGKRLQHRVRLRSFEAVCRMVGLGIGVGIVPRAAAVRHARSAKIQRIRLTDAWAARSLMVCARQLSSMPVHVRQLVRHLTDQPTDAPG